MQGDTDETSCTVSDLEPAPELVFENEQEAHVCLHFSEPDPDLPPPTTVSVEWCGVELDEPLGKNDGAVAGTRYFQCQPKYGLFAPVHKVTKIGFPSEG